MSNNIVKGRPHPSPVPKFECPEGWVEVTEGKCQEGDMFYDYIEGKLVLVKWGEQLLTEWAEDASEFDFLVRKI